MTSGYSPGGELSREEWLAGVELSDAVSRGLRDLTDDQQRLLQRFAMGVNAHPSRIQALRRYEISRARRALRSRRGEK